MKFSTALIVFLALLSPFALATPLHAASDFAALEEAIEAANLGGVGSITLTQDIALSEPTPPITGALTIEGDGHAIRGDGSFRLFDVAGGTLSLKNVTLTGGFSDKNGGAIRVLEGAQLFVDNVAFIDNAAEWGGAIATVDFYGGVEVRDSRFVGNTARTGGGAILLNGGGLDVRNSVFVNNEAGQWGGAVEALNGMASLANSTFVGNSGGNAGGILASGATTMMTHLTLLDNRALWGDADGIERRAGWAGLRNSIVAGAGGGRGCTGGLDESRGNLSDDGSCALLPAGDLRLGEFNGSPGHVPLLDGSPAIDAADAEFCLQTDQIGTARPQGAGCDAGAIESTTGAPPEPTPIPTTCDLRDQILAANTNTAVGACPAGGSHDIIRIAEDITLTEPLPPINGTITIEGNGHTISGDNKFQIFVVDGRKLTINNLTLAKGRGEIYGGAIVVANKAELVVNDSSFERNVVVSADIGGNRFAGGLGGAIGTKNFSGSIHVVNSVFKDNRAEVGGGGIYMSGGRAIIRGSAFINNQGGSFGGAIEVDRGTLNVENSTLYRNRSSHGGISISGGTATMTHLTLLDNRSSYADGDAIHVLSGSARLRNSIIAGGGGKPDCHGNLDASRGNFSQDGTCGSAASGDALLGELTGEPGYFMPLEASPLVDAADPEFCLGADQRGMARPGGAGCDIGAIESDSESLAAQESASDEVSPSDCQVTTTHVLNLRDGPAGARIGSVPANATLAAIARAPGWFRVTIGNSSGWISADYVTLAGDCGADASDDAGDAAAQADQPSERTLSDCRVTTTHGLNLRDSAGVRIGLVPANTTLDAMARMPGWFNVTFRGELGWVSADYVTPSGVCG